MRLRRAAVLTLAICAMNGAASAAPKPPKPVDPKARMPDLAPAVIDDTLAIGGDAIDARKVLTRMTVAVQVNGRGPYRFVVDSGADTSVIGTRAAAALALPAGTPVLLNGMTDSSRVARVLVDTLQLGQTTFSDLQLPVLKDADIGGDGMIGIDALVEQRLMLDFEKRTIAVEDAKLPAQVLDGEIVVTARRRRGQLILTQVTANHLALDAVIDTGTEITIGNVALRDKLIRRGQKFTALDVIGVTGVTATLQMATVYELRLGSVILHDVPVAFAEVPPFAVFGLSEKPALLLGTDLMETFRRVSLDFRARKVRFQLKRCDMTGLKLSTAPNTASRISAGSSEVCRR